MIPGELREEIYAAFSQCLAAGDNRCRRRLAREYQVSRSTVLHIIKSQGSARSPESPVTFAEVRAVARRMLDRSLAARAEIGREEPTAEPLGLDLHGEFLANYLEVRRVKLAKIQEGNGTKTHLKEIEAAVSSVE